MFGYLKNCYQNTAIPVQSYLKQYDECGKILGTDIFGADKGTLRVKLGKKFGSQNLGLVESIKYVFYKFDEDRIQARNLLKDLVWVDFGGVT